MKKYLFGFGLASTIFALSFAYLKLTKSQETIRGPASVVTPQQTLSVTN